jgi:ABC-type transporter Mla subunit MlaD
VPRLPSPGQLLGVLRAQAEALAALPDALITLNRSVRGLSGSLEQAKDALVSVQRVALRLDRLTDELEEPLRELGPGLRRLAVVLNDPVVAELPDTMRQVRADLLPVLTNLRETQQKVASIASSTDRINSLIDEAGARIGGIPARLRRPWRPVEPEPGVIVDVEPGEPPD